MKPTKQQVIDETDEQKFDQNTLKDLLSYCPETGLFKWVGKTNFKTVIGSTAGTTNQRDGYIKICIYRKQVMAHRLAYLFMTGTEPEEEIDHINGVRTDNRWENLRPVSKSENMKNRRIFKNNKSGFTGVSWCKREKKWVAQISVDGNKIPLGYFKGKDEAIDARIIANKRYGFHDNHGDRKATESVRDE